MKYCTLSWFRFYQKVQVFFYSHRDWCKITQQFMVLKFLEYTWYMYVGICNWNSMQLKRQKYLTHHQIIITKWKIKSEAGATLAVSEINFYPYVWPSSAVKFIFLLQQVAHLSVWTKRVLYRNELLIRARNVYYLVD